MARLLLDTPRLPNQWRSACLRSVRHNIAFLLVLHRLGDTRARGRASDTRGAADELGHVHCSMVQSHRSARSFSLPDVRTNVITELGFKRT